MQQSALHMHPLQGKVQCFQMKHVEPCPWLIVNFPSLCAAWSIEYHVYRGWYDNEPGGDLFYEIWNNAYFGEFGFVVKAVKA